MPQTSFRPGSLYGGANGVVTKPSPYNTALNNIRADAGGVTTQVKNPAQNAFSEAIRNSLTAGQAGRKNALTQFVKDAYGRTAGASKALEQEHQAIEKIFAKDGGLMDELADSRAKRKASVMMGTKMAMDRARRQNNVNRMMAGNNTYNDRMYSDALARIAVDAGTQDADLEREDIRYGQGERMGALGTRDQLLRNYLSTSLIPLNTERQFLQDDIGTADSLARLENQNNIYETPEQRMRRQIELADGQAYLQEQADAANPPPPPPRSNGYSPMPYSPQPYPRYGSPVPTMPYGGPIRTGRAQRMLPRFNNLRFAV
jgi:hypothetical protein